MQTDAVAQQLHHLVVAQWIMAVSMGVVALAIIGAAIGALIAIRKVSDKASHTVSGLTHTVEDVTGRLRAVVDGVEDRVKRFGAVVDVVQAEAEELLLDAASTARGVHTTAEMLRSGKGTQVTRIKDEEGN